MNEGDRPALEYSKFKMDMGECGPLLRKLKGKVTISLEHCWHQLTHNKQEWIIQT